MCSAPKVPMDQMSSCSSSCCSCAAHPFTVCWAAPSAVRLSPPIDQYLSLRETVFQTISTKLSPEENLGHLAVFLHLLQHKLWGSLGKLSTSFQRKGAFPGGRLPSCVMKALTSVMPLPGNPFAWGTDCML